MRLGTDDYVLFKNKDFRRSHFDDRIVLEREVFGVEGVTTWAATVHDSDRFSGFSIGANASGLLVCDSNVQILAGHRNYDDLVEIALRQGSDVASGAAAVRRAVKQSPYSWGNLVLIDGAATAAVEVRGDRVHVTIGTRRLARSNHHVVLGAHENEDESITTMPRLVAAEKYLAAASSVEDVFALQQSHDEGTTGICSHASHQTVYSYVLRRRAGKTTLHVSWGRPCESHQPTELELPLGSDFSAESAAAFRSAYPSANTALDA